MEEYKTKEENVEPQPIQLGAFFTAWTSAAMDPPFSESKQLQKLQQKSMCQVSR